MTIEYKEGNVIGDFHLTYLFFLNMFSKGNISTFFSHGLTKDKVILIFK